MMAWWLDNHSAIHHDITDWSGWLVMRPPILLIVLIIETVITLVWWPKWNVTHCNLMIMVGWLVLRHLVLFNTMFISFHISLFSYFDAFIVKRGRLIYSLRVRDGVRSKKKCQWKFVLLPPYHHIKGIYPFESVKDKTSWY